MYDEIYYPDPYTVFNAAECNRLARLATMMAGKADRAHRQPYRTMALEYTQRAIRLAPNSGLRALYAAWYRDYHYTARWEQ